MRQFSLLFLTIILFSCYEDTHNVDQVITIEEQPIIVIETGISGYLNSPEGDPIDDYQLEINGRIHQVNGDFFYFTQENLQKYGQWINVYKEDKLVAVSNVNLIENDLNRLKLQSFGSIKEEALTNDIIISDNIKVQLDRADLAGSGDFIIHKLHIKQQQLVNHFGKSAFGSNGEILFSDFEEVFYFDISTNGTQAEFLEGKSMKLDLSFEGKSLLYYNVEQRSWIKLLDLAGQLVSINKTGFFAIGETQPGVRVDGQLLSEETPISYAKIQTAFSSKVQCTTQGGNWSMTIPETNDLSLVVYDNCDQNIETVLYNEISSEEKQIAEMSNASGSIIDLTTNILDCNGENQINPAINIQTGSNSETYLFEGNEIETKMAFCDFEFNITGVNLETSTRGPALNWDVRQMDELSYLTDCPEYERGFSRIQIKDDVKVYPSFMVEKIDQVTYVRSTDNNLRFKIRATEEGILLDNQVNIFIDDKDFGMDGYRLPCENTEDGCGFDSFNITHYENFNDGWFRVSFEGTLWMQTIENPVAGYFPVNGLIMARL